MGDLAANILIGAAKEYARLKAADLLGKFKGSATPEEYEATVAAGLHFFTALEVWAKKTKSKTDDKVLSIFLEPLREAAEEVGGSEQEETGGE